MIKTTKFLFFGNIILLILTHQGLPTATDAQHWTDPFHYLNLLEKLDTFLNTLVNNSIGSKNCTNLVLVFGDTSQEAVSFVAEIIGNPNLTMTDKEVKIYDCMILKVSPKF